jgi:hypothetical protein
MVLKCLIWSKKITLNISFLHKRHNKVRRNLTTIAASVCIKIASPKGRGRLSAEKAFRNDDSSRLITL